MGFLFWITIFCYIIASSCPILAIRQHSSPLRSGMMLLGAISLGLHALILYNWIDLAAGQNLNFFNMLSFSVWLIGIMVWVIVLMQPVDLLISFIFPLAAGSMILVVLFPAIYRVDTAHNPAMLFHILISILTFCVLFLAGLLAILLAMQQRFLRFNQVSGLAQKLPSLQTMERLLFQAVSFGFILLTLVLITSFYSYHELLWQHLLVLQKTCLVSLAWLVLLMLLIGRYLQGWRGRKAVHFTLTGVLLLLAAYFFSKFVLEMMLK